MAVAVLVQKNMKLSSRARGDEKWRLCTVFKLKYYELIPRKPSRADPYTLTVVNNTKKYPFWNCNY